MRKLKYLGHISYNIVLLPLEHRQTQSPLNEDVQNPVPVWILLMQYPKRKEGLK